MWEMRDDGGDEAEDNWEKLEDEATMSPGAYVTKVLRVDTSYYGCDTEMMAKDLVRRAKRLANEEQ